MRSPELDLRYSDVAREERSTASLRRAASWHAIERVYPARSGRPTLWRGWQIQANCGPFDQRTARVPGPDCPGSHWENATWGKWRQTTRQPACKDVVISVKLRRHLVILIGSVALPLAVFSVLALELLRQGERDARHQAVLEATQSIAFQIDRDIARAEAALQALAASPSFLTEDWMALRAQAAIAAPALETWTVVFDASGRQLVNTRLRAGEALPTTGTPDGFADLLQQSKASVSGVYTGPNTGKQVLRVDYPVALPDGRRFLATVAFEAEYFARLLKTRPLPASWVVAVFDQRGTTVARTHRAAETVGKPGGRAILDASKNASQGRLLTVSREGTKLYDTFVRVDRTGWVVANGVPAAELEGSTTQAIHVIYASFACALALAAIGALFLGGRLSLAFQRVAKAAHAVGTDELPPMTQTNIDELNDIGRQLQESHRRLRDEQQARAGVETEREQLFAAEQDLRKRAEEENRSKDQFMAMLGHELRNPLSAIQGAIGVMRRQAAGGDLGFAQSVIARQASHLTRIVDDLLEVNRVLRGKIELRMEPLNLQAVVEASVASIKASGRLGQRQLDVVLQPVWVRGDRSRLEQIISNLLSNAQKFTHGDGKICVRLEEADGMAVLTVEDNGVGMAEPLLTRAFDPFVQGPTAIDRSQGGLGIGLALVKQLVGDHKGSVEARSAGEGHGTSFVVKFPSVEPDVTVPSTLHAARETHSRCHVLIVDDQADARETLALLLRGEGHEVVTAASGEEALDAIEKNRFDVAIVDIGLPGLDGYEVAKCIRAGAEGHALRLIALTGYGLPDDVQAAAKAGFDIHMVKPVDPDRLLPQLSDLACAKGPL